MIGTPSGGGSAFAHFYTLPNSKLQARLASMVSFKHDGQRYDTHGTHPDIVVDRSPESLLESGKDNQLEAAAAFILSGKGYHAGDQATPQQSVKRDK
jgi:C-terminal processing protease CtpA/Prc